jgi:hypothetical protein
MRRHISLAVAALAGGLLLAPATIPQANAAHGFGGGGFGGGGFGGGAHFAGGMGGPHFAGGTGGPRFAPGRVGGPMAGSRFAGGAWRGGPGWNGTHAAWHGGNWHGHDHDHFVHDHDRFRNRFVAVGFGGWWPGYYDYGGCSWLYNQARYSGSPYWWNRYYACANYY